MLGLWGLCSLGRCILGVNYTSDTVIGGFLGFIVVSASLLPYHGFIYLRKLLAPILLQIDEPLFVYIILGVIATIVLFLGMAFIYCSSVAQLQWFHSTRAPIMMSYLFACFWFEIVSFKSKMHIEYHTILPSLSRDTEGFNQWPLWLPFCLTGWIVILYSLALFHLSRRKFGMWVTDTRYETTYTIKRMLVYFPTFLILYILAVSVLTLGWLV
jgi:hypothetical protein